MDPKRIEKKFVELYGNQPLLVRSPGRINLIGEHTDYNDGFVLPAAIDKEIVFAINFNGERKCRFFSFDLDESDCTELSKINKSQKDWANYLLGVIDQFKKNGFPVDGFDCVFGGDIPVGAGLSSSAAVECGLAFALNHIHEFGIEKMDLVKMAQKAEHEFAGVQCGIMDQFANMFGRTNHAMKLDCRSLQYEYFESRIPDYRIVLFDTQVKHSLASSEYNTRRQECEKGVQVVHRRYPDVKSLRDCSLEKLEECKDYMSDVVYRRCSYVIHENTRVEEGCIDLQHGRLDKFGEKMFQSHDGLSKDYEVSCKELDLLVQIVREKPDIIGARMMGGGFGGCTINLIKDQDVDLFIEEVRGCYKKEMKKDIKFYKVKMAKGTSLI
ncbi:galactokinase [Fulvivirgaceae bacterium BMA10]|uniref:Galactokinase n=1 Tax=Splendidivirga corallicola TaxID=3051826 RepID=A0ABT8KXF0_9BACT|nr:galactokinase [Fulvivirgaceae bacterium BMA10]